MVRTCLHLAIENGQLETLKALLDVPDCIENLYSPDVQERVPLHYAAISSNVKVRKVHFKNKSYAWRLSLPFDGLSSFVSSWKQWHSIPANRQNRNKCVQFVEWNKKWEKNSNSFSSFFCYRFIFFVISISTNNLFQDFTHSDFHNTPTVFLKITHTQMIRTHQHHIVFLLDPTSCSY